MELPCTNESFPLLSLPPEIVEVVLFFTIYSGDEFTVRTVDYPDTEDPDPPLLRLHAAFAHNVILCNRELYRFAMPILWMFVPIRRPSDIRHLAWYAKRGCRHFMGNVLATHVRRVEYQVPEFPSFERLPSLLNSFPGLQVVTVRPPLLPGVPFPAFGRYGHHDLILSGVGLERIQFDSLLQRPTLYDLRHLFNRRPALKTLRVMSIHPWDGGPYPVWEGRHAVNVMPALALLSLGSPHHLLEGQEAETFNSFVSMLTAHRILPSLSILHLYAHTSATHLLFETFGPQLRHLTVVAPPHNQQLNLDGMVGRCVDLVSLLWIVPVAKPEAPVQDRPHAHPTLQHLTVSIPVLGVDIRSQVNEIVGQASAGGFPALRRIQVDLRGTLEATVEDNALSSGSLESGQDKHISVAVTVNSVVL